MHTDKTLAAFAAALKKANGLTDAEAAHYAAQIGDAPLFVEAGKLACIAPDGTARDLEPPDTQGQLRREEKA